MRARETVTAEVATTVYFLPKSEAPAVELGPNGQREARLSVLLAPSDASLRKAYIDDIEWAEAKRQYVERVLAEAYERKAATARRTRIVSLMPSASQLSREKRNESRRVVPTFLSRQLMSAWSNVVGNASR